MSDPVLKLYSAREPAHFVYTIEKMLEFSQSRENPLKEDLKVVGGEDEELKSELIKLVQYYINIIRPDRYKLAEDFDGKGINETIEFIKSRDQRIVLEAREDQTNIILGIVTKRGMPDNYYGEVAQWIKEGLKQSQKEEQMDNSEGQSTGLDSAPVGI
jgi:hypothetical protein